MREERPETFIVAGAFQFQDRGCVLVPGFRARSSARQGACLLLRRPDGTLLRTVIQAMELVEVRPPAEAQATPILLPPSVMKSDVPAGTVVTLLAPPAHADDVLLFEVAGTFAMKDVGVVLVPGGHATATPRPGDTLVLVRPDGTTLGAIVKARATFGPPVEPSPVLVHPPSLTEIPRGTLVFALKR